MTRDINSPLPSKRLTATEIEIRRIISTILLVREEAYSVDFWKEWVKQGGEANKKRGVPRLQRVLRLMEDEGLLTGRDVTGAEHKKSMLIRRYYKQVIF